MPRPSPPDPDRLVGIDEHRRRLAEPGFVEVFRLEGAAEINAFMGWTDD